MSTKELSPVLETHEVLNQPPPLENYNLYASDAVLKEAVHREGAAWAEGELRAFGEKLGRPDFLALGTLANANLPQLRTHDRYGHRLDEVEYHPAWHELMRTSIAEEVHALPWNRTQRGSHVTRAAKHFLMTQVEAGHLCPVTMTFAVVPAMRVQPEVAAEWVPRVTSTAYDPGMRPAPDKAGCLMGMAMTEKQGGSDVRANSTRAAALGAEGPGQEYHLTGHKWFCSAPMCDAFLTLAQTEKGLSCFIVPRFLPDGTRNRFRIQRLKDKLGNRSNASSEIEFAETWGRMVGEEGRGVRTIIEMVNHTRLDCGIGAAGLMRQAVTQALHHCRHRSAFGKPLIAQPLMRNVLADLALESEASTVLMMRMARAYDDAAADPVKEAFLRIATAIAKYWVCKRGPAMVYEALECLGGAGYVEDYGMARIYREIPLGSIWEGSGNVMALDVLRAAAREPETVPAVLAELSLAKGADTRFDAHLASVETELANRDALEPRARRIVEKLALGLQASLLLRHAPRAISQAFCGARLAGEGGQQYGTLPPDAPLDAILERAALA